MKTARYSEIESEGILELTYETEPAKIGYICAQLDFGLIFELQLTISFENQKLSVTSCATFMPYPQINKKAKKVYRT